MASPFSTGRWSTGSLFHLVIRGRRARWLLPGRGWLASAAEAEALSSPGALGMFPPEHFLKEEKQKLVRQRQPSERQAGNTCEPEPAGEG